MNETDTINLFTTDELVDELRRRYPDGAIIAYAISSDQVKSERRSWSCHVKGNSSCLSKLAFVINHNVNEVIQLGAEEAELLEGDEA